MATSVSKVLKNSWKCSPTVLRFQLLKLRPLKIKSLLQAAKENDQAAACSFFLLQTLLLS